MLPCDRLPRQGRGTQEKTAYKTSETVHFVSWYFDLLIFAPKGYTACECRASNETCITPYGEHINKLCSGQGECVCGECKCAETQDGQYSGRYCEECPVSREI